MAITKAQVGAHSALDGVVINDLKVVGEQVALIVALTDSTTGTVSNTINDTTSSVKDDLAALGAKINEIIAALKAHGLVASA